MQFCRLVCVDFVCYVQVAFWFINFPVPMWDFFTAFWVYCACLHPNVFIWCFLFASLLCFSFLTVFWDDRVSYGFFFTCFIHICDCDDRFFFIWDFNVYVKSTCFLNLLASCFRHGNMPLTKLSFAFPLNLNGSCCYKKCNFEKHDSSVFFL